MFFKAHFMFSFKTLHFHLNHALRFFKRKLKFMKCKLQATNVNYDLRNMNYVFVSSFYVSIQNLFEKHFVYSVLKDWD